MNTAFLLMAQYQTAVIPAAMVAKDYFGLTPEKFIRACNWLDIEDLRFHDLRRAGVTRLFEMGWGIPQVAAVSLHKDWNMLRRYTNMKQVGDRYKGWKWMQPALDQRWSAGRQSRKAAYAGQSAT